MAKIEGDLAQALRLLEQYFKDKDIPIALVGALVPIILLPTDTETLQLGTRETRDADHVINLTSWAEWDAVIEELVTIGFKRARGEQEHKLHYGFAEIDLIPYGLADGPPDVLTWRQSGNVMNLCGFGDVFRYAVPTELAPGLTLPTVPLWLFAVLKVIAYLDRRFARDVSDLAYVLEHYEPPNGSTRRFDILGVVDGVSLRSAGAYLLGFDISQNACSPALNLIESFVQEVQDEYHPVVSAILGEEKLTFSEDHRTRIFQLFSAFRKGLKQ